MSIQSEIKRISDNIASAYNEVRSKGGTVPAQQLSGNLAAAIQSIPAGAELQEYHSTLTLSSTGTNPATGSVNCGFQPDAVLLYGLVSNGLPSQLAVMFNDETTQVETSCYDTNGLWWFWATRTQTGFTYELGMQGWNWNALSVNGRSFSVYAVKFT